MERKGIYLYIDEHEAPTNGFHTISTNTTSTARSGPRRQSTTSEPLSARTHFSTPSQQPNTPPPINGGEPILEESADAKNLAGGNFDSRSSSAMVNSLAVLICAAVGVALGIVLSKLDVNSDVQTWIALPGTLFVRALRCLVVPLVFTSMAVSVAEVVVLNRTSVLTWRTAAVFLFTSVSAALEGMAVALIFRSVFVAPVNAAGASTSTTPMIALQCANGNFLEDLVNGTMACTGANSTMKTAMFELTDVNNVLSIQGSFQNLSLTDQVIAIINLIVTDNIFSSMANGSLLSIIAFAVPLGIAIAKSHVGEVSTNYLLNLLRQVRNAMLSLVNAVLVLTPVAVLCLVSSAIMNYHSNAGSFIKGVAYLAIAFVSGVICHVFIVLPSALFLFTRIQPYNYLRQLFPAYVFAFGCSSSMATLPVAVTVVHQTRQVSPGLAQLIMCLGTPVNTNAAGLYYPLMTMFMACMSGQEGNLGIPQIIVLFCVSWLGSMGTAPVPNAALVMLMTVWKTVLPNIPLPQSFVYVVAVDFLFDRICTMTNVNGNMVATRILANMYDDRSSGTELD
ncbi:dicarboxylate/amino acid:cation (Na or H) symporter (DAACS) family protein [Thraustotheca clavata]|uniref:Amino acid transporter n=1 Tax=Thraustotheca clavata TaxID=74557 RepID=A0A1V9Y786_9STRA|nr:dicarboxylate/amino acid:cation (Na or H) symporter (DAACS) family protein [Thraustotheca clavata]